MAKGSEEPERPQAVSFLAHLAAWRENMFSAVRGIAGRRQKKQSGAANEPISSISALDWLILTVLSQNFARGSFSDSGQNKNFKPAYYWPFFLLRLELIFLLPCAAPFFLARPN